MVWMPTRCPVCGSDKRSDRSLCTNQEANGAPCHGLSEKEAAFAAAARAFQRDEITLDEYEAQVAQALIDPPKRQFWMITVLR